MEMSEDLGDVGYGDGHQRGETVIHRGNSWAILNECAVMNGAHLRKVSVRLPIHWIKHSHIVCRIETKELRTIRVARVDLDAIVNVINEEQKIC
uniref:DUF4283 domain-containing protein n=1 Tax=Ascaris lumbricoides TaxID=6252 RepID=A0A0M3IKM0_ASCLU